MKIEGVYDRTTTKRTIHFCCTNGCQPIKEVEAHDDKPVLEYLPDGWMAVCLPMGIVPMEPQVLLLCPRCEAVRGEDGKITTRRIPTAVARR